MNQNISERLFCKVADHLLRQMRKSQAKTNPTLDNIFCAYRGEESLSCAVGCLIKDEFYTPDMEGDTITGSGSTAILLAICSSECVSLSDLDLDVLASLQNIHDKNDPEDWRDLLMEEAERYEYYWTPGASS